MDKLLNKGKREEDMEAQIMTPMSPQTPDVYEEQEEEDAEVEEDEELEYDEGEGDDEEAEDDDELFENVDNDAPEENIMTGQDIVTDSFGELVVDESAYQAANDAWRLFTKTAESQEAAGEVIYSAIFESSPSLQSLFVSPRAVAAMKFFNGLASFVNALNEPKKTEDPG